MQSHISSLLSSSWFGEVKGRRCRSTRFEVWHPLTSLRVFKTHLTATLPYFSSCRKTRCFWPRFSALIWPTDVKFQLRRGGNVTEILTCHNSETGGANTVASTEVLLHISCLLLCLCCTFPSVHHKESVFLQSLLLFSDMERWRWLRGIQFCAQMGFNYPWRKTNRCMQN